MRLRDWSILTAHRIASAIGGLTDTPHLTTDPACAEYRPPRPGSRLDRHSRGVSCTPCMVARAYGRDLNLVADAERAYAEYRAGLIPRDEWSDTMLRSFGTLDRREG